MRDWLGLTTGEGLPLASELSPIFYWLLYLFRAGESRLLLRGMLVAMSESENF